MTNDPYLSTDIQMADFSSWGPTDDGRIKPDVVANGVDLYSSLSDSNSSYGVMSGTSMASPNAAGTAVLLKEHFETSLGYSPLSSTLKGLIIHTASDAGTVGPDYSYGWGLVDAETAAEFITATALDSGDAEIIEATYNGVELTHEVLSAGTNPLTATIVWTDAPGTAASGTLDDTTSVLVNDLDIWITDSNGNTYYPWTLDPSNPTTAAVQTSANHIDNVEQVKISLPEAGEYTIHIGATGTVTGQEFSLLISNEGQGVSPELVLVIPQEGGFVDRGDVLSLAPQELTLRFNEGQQFIDETTDPVRDPNGWLSGETGGIQVIRSVNGVWGDGDDEVVEIGWIGIGDRANDVVIRFAETLPDDLYRISIIGTDNYIGPDGEAVDPLLNIQQIAFRDGAENEQFEFELDLGAQVTSVVQQPVVVTGATIVTTSAANIPDATSFTVGDGKDLVSFEFNNPGASNYLAGSQTGADVQINLSSSDDADDVALAIAAAIRNQTVSEGGPLDLVVDYAFYTSTVDLSGDRVVFYGDDLPLTVSETRVQLEDTIEVYFNDDDLDPDSVQNPSSISSSLPTTRPPSTTTSSTIRPMVRPPSALCSPSKSLMMRTSTRSRCASTSR